MVMAGQCSIQAKLDAALLVLLFLELYVVLIGETDLVHVYFRCTTHHH